jgi:cytochrome c-type biogenesis protein CcmH/NrfG
MICGGRTLGTNMRRIGLAILAVAALGASHAAAQGNNDSMLLELGANQLSDAQREATQRNIDRATRALRDKDYATARKYAQPVTRADPKRIEAWLMLGAAQLGLEEWGKARTAYTTALRITPGHPEARAGLGVAMAKSKDPRATVQLAWFDEKLQACGQTCPQAAQLAKLRNDVQSAIAEAAKGS